jgi:hypothetical protein
VEEERRSAQRAPRGLELGAFELVIKVRDAVIRLVAREVVGRNPREIGPLREHFVSPRAAHEADEPAMSGA